MIEAEIVPAPVPYVELVCVPTLASDRNPALVHLASLTSPLSRRVTRCALEQIADELTGQRDIEQVAWHGLRYQHVMALRAALSGRLKPRTVNRMLSAVKGVIAQAESLELVDAETAARIRRVKGVWVDKDALAGRAVEDDEVERLLDACSGTGLMALRDTALLALLFGAGLRRREAATVEVLDFDFARGRVSVLGKGRKRRTVQLAPVDALRVRAWREARGGVSGPLLVSFTPRREVKVSEDGSMHPLTETGIYEVLRVIAGRAGVEGITPHDARRTRATRMIAHGTGIEHARRALGHESSATTDRYDRTKDETTHAVVGKVGMLG